MSIAVVLLNLLTGFMLVRMVWPNALRLCRHDVLRLSLGAGLGMALASLITFLVDAAFGGQGWLMASLDLAMFAIAAGAYGTLRRASPCVFCEHPPAQESWGWLSLGFTLSILAAIASFITFTATNPNGEWDAWAIWNNHARFLASGAGWRQMFSPFLVWSIQDYPLLVPGAIANAWRVAGSADRVAPVATAGVFLFASAGVLFGALELLRGRAQALLAGTVLFGAASVIRMGASQYADVPLAFYYVAGGALVCIETPEAYWLAGMMAGCAAWTKNEGLVFVCVLIAAQAVVAWRRSQLASGWKPLIMLVGGAVPPLLFVAWFKLAYAPANYLFTEQQPLANRLGDVSRYITVAVEFGKQLFTFGGWILPPVLIAVGYAWLVGRSRSSEAGRTTALIALLSMILAYAGVYVFTTKDINWQIETSLSRVLMQLWPLAVLVFFLFTRPPQQTTATAAPASPAKRTRGR